MAVSSSREHFRSHLHSTHLSTKAEKIFFSVHTKFQQCTSSFSPKPTLGLACLQSCQALFDFWPQWPSPSPAAPEHPTPPATGRESFSHHGATPGCARLARKLPRSHSERLWGRKGLPLRHAASPRLTEATTPTAPRSLAPLLPAGRAGQPGAVPRSPSSSPYPSTLPWPPQHGGGEGPACPHRCCRNSASLSLRFTVRLQSGEGGGRLRRLPEERKPPWTGGRSRWTWPPPRWVGEPGGEEVKETPPPLQEAPSLGS